MSTGPELSGEEGEDGGGEVGPPPAKKKVCDVVADMYSEICINASYLIQRKWICEYASSEAHTFVNHNKHITDKLEVHKT